VSKPSPQQKPKKQSFEVVDIGSGVSICELPFDPKKYERLVSQFRNSVGTVRRRDANTEKSGE